MKPVKKTVPMLECEECGATFVPEDINGIERHCGAHKEATLKTAANYRTQVISCCATCTYGGGFGDYDCRNLAMRNGTDNMEIEPLGLCDHYRG